jgi:hypothetical protein
MLRAMRLFLLGQPLLVILLTMASAAAQTAPNDSSGVPDRVRGHPTAAAEALYHRGVSEFQAGRYESACRALAESYRLEALPGVLFTLATCEARAGRVASSAAHFQDFLELVSRLPAEQRALQHEREHVARAERAALLADVPTLTITLGGAVPAQAVVHIDGAVLGAAGLGRALPVDPGEHVLDVTLADGARSEQRVVVQRREKKRVTLALPAPRVVEVDAPPPAPQPSLLPWKVTAGIVGGLGLAAGITTGALAWKQKGIVEDNCDGNQCNATGKDAADLGQTEALISTIGYGVGLTGVAVLVVLYLTDRKGVSNAAAPVGSGLVVTPQGVALGGAF